MGQSQSYTPPTSRPVVLILGGGYSGVTLAKRLDSTGRTFVVLVDEKEFMLHSIATPRALVEKNFAQNLFVPYDKLLTNGVVIHAKVTSIHPRAVFLHDRPLPLRFDYLVLALGANYTFPFHMQTHIPAPITPVSGFGEPIEQTVNGSDDSSLHYTLDALNQYNSLYESIRSARKILIVGGGCTGVEACGEIAFRYGAMAGTTPPASSPNAIAAAAAPTTTAAKPGVSTNPFDSPAPPNASPVASPIPNLTSKEITLVHSRSHLMSRQEWIREETRSLALQKLRSMGVKVHLQQRVDFDSLQFRPSMNPFAAPPSEEVLERSPEEWSDRLKKEGMIVAPKGSMFTIQSFSTSPIALTPTSIMQSTAFQCDLILLCTGVNHSSIMQPLVSAAVASSGKDIAQSSELARCLDSLGRICVNPFMQLDGYVPPDKKKHSIEQAEHKGQLSTTSDIRSIPPVPAPDSKLHEQFAFHYPNVFAMGDCCITQDERLYEMQMARNQSHYVSSSASSNGNNLLSSNRSTAERKTFKLSIIRAQLHAEAVATNIDHCIRNQAIQPLLYSGASASHRIEVNAPFFLTMGPRTGVTQLSDATRTILGDEVTCASKGLHMAVEANWRFLNQRRGQVSFKGRMSRSSSISGPSGTPTVVASSASPSTSTSSGVAAVVPPTADEEMKHYSPDSKAATLEVTPMEGESALAGTVATPTVQGYHHALPNKLSMEAIEPPPVETEMQFQQQERDQQPLSPTTYDLMKMAGGFLSSP